jgi:hypothetical protein
MQVNVQDASEIVAERSAKYGPPHPNMAGTSQQIAGLLTQMLSNGQMRLVDCGSYQRVELSDWAAALFMATVKIDRMGTGVAHADNIVDAMNYLQFALEMQKE